MHDADERFLERLRAELEAALGPTATVSDLSTHWRGESVRIVAHCRTPVGPWTLEAEGAGLVDAASGVVQRAHEDRLAIAFRELVAAR